MRMPALRITLSHLVISLRTSLAYSSAVPPLADVAAGRAATEPAAASISLRSRADNLFRRPSLENAERLMRGSLDLSFVAVVVAPLLLIALGHGLFSADRDSGAARLVLAQAGGLGPLLLARSVPRLSLVILPILLALLLLAALRIGGGAREHPRQRHGE